MAWKAEAGQGKGKRASTGVLCGARSGVCADEGHPPTQNGGRPCGASATPFEPPTPRSASSNKTSFSRYAYGLLRHY